MNSNSAIKELSSWIINELGPILPQGFELSFKEGEFTDEFTIVYWDKSSDTKPESYATTLWDDFTIHDSQQVTYNILNLIQDFIVESSTKIWPQSTEFPIKNLALPKIHITDDVIHAKFSYEARTIFELEPFNIESLFP